jgi:hypothetical protein
MARLGEGSKEKSEGNEESGFIKDLRDIFWVVFCVIQLKNQVYYEISWKNVGFFLISTKQNLNLADVLPYRRKQKFWAFEMTQVQRSGNWRLN